jgi:hypothetical protein
MRKLINLIEIAYVELTRDPDYIEPGYSVNIGATVHDIGPTERTIWLPISSIILNEPDKTKKYIGSIDSHNRVVDIIKSLKLKIKLPSLLVKIENNGDFLLIDGHHRLEAYKRMGFKKVPCRIIPNKNVREIPPIFKKVIDTENEDTV